MEKKVLAEKYVSNLNKSYMMPCMVGVILDLFITASLAVTLFFIVNWIAMLVVLVVGLGIIPVLVLIIRKVLRSRDEKATNDIITYFPDEKSISVFSAGKYTTILLSEITEITYNDVTYVKSGHVTIPCVHEYGPIIISYNRAGREKKITSFDVKNVKNVHKELTGLLPRKSKEGKK